MLKDEPFEGHRAQLRASASGRKHEEKIASVNGRKHEDEIAFLIVQTYNPFTLCPGVRSRRRHLAEVRWSVRGLASNCSGADG
jgi:hypothetical protein